MARTIALSTYNALPVFAQNLAFTILGYRSRHIRYGGAFHRRLRELQDSEWWDADRINEFHRTQLRQMIRHCYDTVPYYHDLFDANGIRPEDIAEVTDLPQVPLLTKDIVREQGDRLISSHYRDQKLIKILTSGTSGKAMEIFFTPQAQQEQWAIVWRHRARFGFRFGDRFLMFGARQPVPITQEKPPYWRTNRAFGQTYMSIYHLTPKYMPAIVDYLNETGFEFFAGYPSAMAVLAAHIRESGQRLYNRPKIIFTGSEALLPSVKALLQEVFGARVTEVYGSVESVAGLSKCEHDTWHHDFELGITELLNAEDNPNGPKRIVATGFVNPAMPLLRYQVGDVAIPSNTVCPCGRKSQTLDRIDGRVEDYIRTPDGRKVVGMNQVFEWAPGAREIQIVQHVVDEIIVKIVKYDSYSERDTNALMAELRSRVGKELKITIEFVEQIQRTKNGKFRAVLSTLSADSTSALDRDLAKAVSEGTV